MVALAARLGAGRRTRIVLAGGGLLAFTVLVGPDASVQRAAVMACVVLASGFGGKRAIALPSLGTAILALLLADPWNALQPGFALSVAATAGILLLVPALRSGLARIPHLPEWIVLPVAVALAAQLACGPILLLLRPGIPAMGVLANVLAAPAAPLGTGLGLLALLLPPLGVPGQVLGAAALWLGSLAARWVAATAEVAAALPLSTLQWPGGWLGAVMLAGVEAALLLAWALATGRVSLPGGARAAARQPWRPAPERPRALRLAIWLLAGAAAGVFVAVAAAAPMASRLGTPRDWAVVACDVGQGDAMLLRDPERPGETMLIDTGDDPEALDACLDRFGVSRIALLVLTHDDRDHVGALEAIAGRTDAALIAPDSLEDGGSRAVRSGLERAGVPYRIAGAGLEGGPPALRWRVLAPPPGAIPADTNAASIVLRVHAGGIELVALADTGAEEQRSLLAAGADLGADAVKVAHHGSSDQDPALLQAIGARVGLISVGADNGYGHPSRGALDALGAAGTAALRTDEHGSIALSVRDGRLATWVER